MNHSTTCCCFLSKKKSTRYKVRLVLSLISVMRLVRSAEEGSTVLYLGIVIRNITAACSTTPWYVHTASRWIFLNSTHRGQKITIAEGLCLCPLLSALRTELNYVLITYSKMTHLWAFPPFCPIFLINSRHFINRLPLLLLYFYYCTAEKTHECN